MSEHYVQELFFVLLVGLVMAFLMLMALYRIHKTLREELLRINLSLTNIEGDTKIIEVNTKSIESIAREAGRRPLDPEVLKGLVLKALAGARLPLTLTGECEGRVSRLTTHNSE